MRPNWLHSLRPESPPYPPNKGFYLLFVFGFLDVILSAVAITYWDAKELNPFAAWVWQNFGILGLIWGKLLLFFLAVTYHHVWPNSGQKVVWLCATVQIVVVTLTLLVHLLV